MDTTDNLQLPYLMPSQAQKHVTHNEALGALDALVQLAVVDRDLAAPPASPVNGSRYIVAAGATGDWTGKTGQIAHRLDGAWSFHSPRTGWVAFVADENRFVTWSGTAWADFDAAIRALQNLALFGLGTTADSTNPFSAKLNKALWTAKTAGEGGDGDLRYTLNKETASDVLSFLMQTGYSGRAEFGLVGDDNVTLKVSGDGSAWTTALTVNKSTGLANVAGNPTAGLGIAPKQYVDAADALKVAKSGDTMTGALALPSASPTGAYDATHKTYVDAGNALKVAKAGDTMTGALILAADPSTALGAATKQYVDGIVAAQDAMVFKGVIDCSANPNYPAADRGWTYRVSVAGKIGGTSGVAVEIGDIVMCLTDGTASGNQAAAGTAWSVIQANIDGALTSAGGTMTGALILPAANPTNSYEAAHKSYVDAERDTRVSTAGDTVAGNLTVSGTGNALTVQGSATFGGTAVATRVANFNTAGQLTARYDTAALIAPLTFQNYGINATSQGSIVDFYFGTGGVLGARAGYFGVLSQDTWALAANQSARFAVFLANAGSIGERFAVSATGTVSINGSTVIDNGRYFRLRSLTIGTLATASAAATGLIFASDLGGGGDQLISDGTNWRRSSRGGTQAVATDTAFTLAVLTSAEEIRHTGTLTADRAITLSTTNAYSGARFRVTRTGGGSFNLSLGGLKNLVANTWAEAIYDGTAWYLAAYGAL